MKTTAIARGESPATSINSSGTGMATPTSHIRNVHPDLIQRAPEVAACRRRDSSPDVMRRNEFYVAVGEMRRRRRPLNPSMISVPWGCYCARTTGCLKPPRRHASSIQSRESLTRVAHREQWRPERSAGPHRP